MRDSETRRWAHPATILVATDLSDLDHLMPFAMEQARESAARLILLHVLSTTAAINADAAGMPYYDIAGALEIAEQMLRPWCELAARRGIRCDALVREGQYHPSNCSRHPPVSGRSRAGRNTEPEQARQVAHWLCGRTSAALGLPPGHYRGTRGSSPGGQGPDASSTVSSFMPPHFERPLARARRLPAKLRPARKPGWFCSMCFRTSLRWKRKGLPTGMDSAAMRRAAHARRANRRRLLLRRRAGGGARQSSHRNPGPGAGAPRQSHCARRHAPLGL